MKNDTKIWDLSENFVEKKTLAPVIIAEFEKLSSSIICGTGPHGEIKIFDTETGNILVSLQEDENETNEDGGILSATFSWDDQLVLCDGILWDYRYSRQIHKFDKFLPNGSVSEKFNKNGFEVIINSEIWDLRTFKLIRTVPALDQKLIMMNNLGDVIFALQHKQGKHDQIIYGKSFSTIDACDYDLITTVPLDHNRTCFAMSLSNDDMNLAVLETSENLPMDSVVRLWEIGANRSAGDEGQDESEEGPEDEESYPLSSEEDNLFTLSDNEAMDDEDDFIDAEDDMVDDEFM